MDAKVWLPLFAATGTVVALAFGAVLVLIDLRVSPLEEKIREVEERSLKQAEILLEEIRRLQGFP